MSESDLNIVKRVAGAHWSNVLINEHCMVITASSENQLIKANDLLLKIMSRKMDDLKGDKWVKYLTFLKNGKKVDLSSILNKKVVWHGKAESVNSQGINLISKVSVIPCLLENDTIDWYSIVLSIPDMNIEVVREDTKSIEKESADVPTYFGSILRKLSSARLREKSLKSLVDDLRMYMEHHTKGKPRIIVINSEISLMSKFVTNLDAMDFILKSIVDLSFQATPYGVVTFLFTGNGKDEITINIEDTNEIMQSADESSLRRLYENSLRLCKKVCDEFGFNLKVSQKNSGGSYTIHFPVNILNASETHLPSEEQIIWGDKKKDVFIENRSKSAQLEYLKLIEETVVELNKELSLNNDSLLKVLHKIKPTLFWDNQKRAYSILLELESLINQNEDVNKIMQQRLILKELLLARLDYMKSQSQTEEK